VDFDGTYIVVNTAAGRQKEKNMSRNPRVALSIVDPENVFRYLEIRGRVAERTEAGADAHIDKMSKKYLGQDKYPFRRPNEVRVLSKIEPIKPTQRGCAPRRAAARRRAKARRMHRAPPSPPQHRVHRRSAWSGTKGRTTLGRSPPRPLDAPRRPRRATASSDL